MSLPVSLYQSRNHETLESNLNDGFEDFVLTLYLKTAMTGWEKKYRRYYKDFISTNNDDILMFT